MTMMATRTLDFTTPHLLRNAREYRAAVVEISALLGTNPKRATDAYDRLEFLAVLVEAYEDRHDPIDESGGTPQSVVDFMLGQHDMTRAELASVLGGKSRVSEFFAGKRPLSVAQIRALRDLLGIPADLLLG